MNTALGFIMGSLTSDTITICQGERIQLFTKKNKFSYSWSPSINITDTSIYNPIVNPDTTTTYYVQVLPEGNLVTNGNFDLGNTGFSSDYKFTPNGTVKQGFYSIFNDPTQFNTAFYGCKDHTDNDAALMMVVDGAVVLDEQVWCETMEVSTNTEYIVSAWITGIHPTEPSSLQFSINGVLLGNVLDIEQAPCEWIEFSQSWISGPSTQAKFCITNQSTISFGNDFALDDIYFMSNDSSFVDTFTIVVLENSETKIDTVSCAGTYVLPNGETILRDTQLLLNLFNLNGCDSTVFINVEVIDTNYFETRIDSLCFGDTLVHLGFPIFRDTAICDIYTNVNGCDSSYCLVVYFFGDATIIENVISPTCFEDTDGSIEIIPFAGNPPYKISWENGNTNPMIKDLASGIYQVTIEDAKGCLTINSINLLEPLPLQVDYDLLPPTCHDSNDGELSLFFSGGTPPYIYSVNGGDFSDLSFISSLSSGDYLLEVLDENNCNVNETIEISEAFGIEINLMNDTTIELGQSIELKGNVTSVLPYELEWTPDTGLDCAFCDSPTVRAPSGFTTFQLLVKNEVGCIEKGVVNISVEENYDLFIPNVFSPNGDGINDVFEIYFGDNLSQIYNFKIFNRWGAVVFEENCFDNRIDCNWDGNHRSIPVQEGVYVYTARIRFIDGEERWISGDVLVMR